MMKIPRLLLFIINKAKLRRLVLGLSARQLSLNLKHHESYVAKIEDENQVNIFPTHEWPNLANELGCEVHDLLPVDEVDQISTGSLVDKCVLSLKKESDLLLVIETLIDYGYFNESKSLLSIAKHLHTDGIEESDLLLSIVRGLEKSNVLIKNRDGFIKY